MHNLAWQTQAGYPNFDGEPQCYFFFFLDASGNWIKSDCRTIVVQILVLPFSVRVQIGIMTPL